jgi:hypothetical protein
MRDRLAIVDDGFLERGVKVPEESLPSRLSAAKLRDTFVPKDDPLYTGEITKETVGLGNVDNTSDLDKPVSTATQAAINAAAGGGSFTNPAFTGVTSFKNEAGTILAQVTAAGEYQHEVPGAGIILRSLGGQRFRLVIGDDGAITSTPLT